MLKFEFVLQQTAASWSASPIFPKLRSKIKRISKLVAFQEIEGLAQFNLAVNTMSDDELLSINVASLGHDFLTDVITFEIERSANSGSLEAEIYISIERAKENAGKFKEPFESEITRLVIHGILHLAGYTDKTPESKKRMRNRERLYLAEIET